MLDYEALDGRFTGDGIFSHRVSVQSSLGNFIDRSAEFQKLRIWCWETFGPSVERDSYIDRFWRIRERLNPYWAWHFSGIRDNSYIYLTEQGFTQFKLKWG